MDVVYMTATNKQKRCILALSHELEGKNLSWNDLEGISREKASEMIDELRDEIENGNGKKAPDKENHKVDGATFGMCFKQIVKHHGIGFPKSNSDNFIEQVRDLYSVAIKAKQYLAQVGPDSRVVKIKDFVM